MASTDEAAPGSIDVVNDEDHLRYELTLDGEPVGIAEYVLAPDRVIFTHTEIATERRRQGLGEQLVAAALADVRSKGLGVVPRCPFVAAYLDQHPDAARRVQ